MPSRHLLLSALLLLVAALAYLLGNNAAPLLDRDEPRYAITSRNMLTSGDYIVPRQYDRPRTAKPPMIYWLQANSMRLLGDNEFAARLPSAVSMLLVVVLLLLTLRRETDAATALLATTLFSFSGLTLFLAKICITDAALLLFTAPAWYSLYRLWRGDRSIAVFALLGVSTGLALLTKGPVSPLILATTALALRLLTLIDRRHPAASDWRTFVYPPATRSSRQPSGLAFKWLLAIAIAVAIALPWYVLVEQRASGFLSKALHNDIVDRSTVGVDGQARPPGFYLLTVFGTFFPWSFLLPLGIVVGWKNRHRPLNRFCLAAVLGPWLMFESVTSKMVHWFLPVFLPLSVLTADAILRCLRGQYTDLHNRTTRVVVILWACITAGLGLLPWLLVVQLPPTPWWTAALLTVCTLVMSVGPAVLMFRHRWPAAIALMAGSMALLFPLTFGLVVPNWWFVTLGRDVGLNLRAARPASPTHATLPNSTPDTAMIGIQEPSIAFYQGGTARESDRRVLDLPPPPPPSPPSPLTSASPPSTSPDIPLARTANYACVSRDIFDALPDSARSQWVVLSRHRGIAYANDVSKVVEVYVLRRRVPLPVLP